MIDRFKFNDFIRNILCKNNLQEAHALVSQFMCKCLSLVKDTLPPVGHFALSMAFQHWVNKEGDAVNLEPVRVECWKYLDLKNNNSVAISDREDVIMRALLCVLYDEPESEDFIVESAEWFANMFDQLGNYSVEFENLMKT